MSLARQPKNNDSSALCQSYMPEVLRQHANLLPKYLADSAVCELIYYPSSFEASCRWICELEVSAELPTLLTIDMSLAIDEVLELANLARAGNEFMHIVVVNRDERFNASDEKAISQVSTREALLEAGVDEYLHLPIEPVQDEILLSSEDGAENPISLSSETINWEKIVKALTETSQGTVIVKSLDHRFLYVNDVFLKKIGLKEADVLGLDDLEVGLPPLSVLGNKVNEFRGFWKLDNDAVRLGRSSSEIEYSIQYLDNTKYIMRTTRTPLKDAQGNVCQLLIQSEDVTHQSRIEHDLESLSQIMAGMLNKPDLNATFQNVAHGLRQVTRADYCYLTKVSDCGEFLETVAHSGKAEHLRSVVMKKGEGVSGVAWETKKPSIAKNYKQFSNRLRISSDTKQCCSIPLLVDGEVKGTLGVAYKREWPTIDGDLAVIEKYAQITRLALEHTLLHQKNKIELARTQAVTGIGQKLNSASDLQVMLDKACVKCITAFDAECIHILEYTNEKEFVKRSAWGLIDGKITSIDEVHTNIFKQSICQWSMDNYEMAILPEYYDDPRETEFIHQRRRQLKRGATIVIPLTHNNEVFGCLVMYRQAGTGNFTSHDGDLLYHLGEQLSSSIQRIDLMQEVLSRANNDLLTGLSNRSYFETQLFNKIENYCDQVDRFMLLFIDLDGFKAVNDNLGHSAGDKLLVQLSERFQAHFPDHSITARIGGDEFGVIIDNLESIGGTGQDLDAFLQSTVDLVEKEFIIGESRASVSASVGVSFFPEDGADSVELLKHADIAMYSVKSSSKCAFRIYDDELGRCYEERLRAEIELTHAIDNNELRLHYQPKVNCKTGSVDSVEALVRWQHPERGLLSPKHFIGVAEESGQIVDIGNWVIDEAIRQASQWYQSNICISVAINVAASQFARSDFADSLLSKIQVSKLPYALLQLEVTESVVMKDINSVQLQLDKLKDRGITIAVDDFGTGYSSLQYLKDLSVNSLKIDKSFVDNLCDGEKDQVIARTIVSIANTLGLETVAEGVETFEQKSILAEMGCDYIQGFYYSPPVDAHEILLVIEHIKAIEHSVELPKAS